MIFLFMSRTKTLPACGPLPFMALLSLILGSISCFGPSPSPSTSQLSAIISEDVSNEAIAATVTENRVVIMVNMATARSTIIKDGVVVDQWNSAIADVTGLYHLVYGAPNPKSTPFGIFSIDDIQHCPSWYPGAIEDFAQVSPASETEEAKYRSVYVNSSQQRYWELINASPGVYGPCGSGNPLGHHVIWFHKAYGFHGTSPNSAHILDRATDERMVSGGCVRNPISKIKQLVESLAIIFGLTDFEQEMWNNGPQSSSSNTLTYYTSDANKYDARVIVGSFSSDLPFKPELSKDNTVKLRAGPRSGVTCEMTHDQVPIYDDRIFKNVIGYYSLGDTVRVHNYAERRPNGGDRVPMRTDDGWISRYYSSLCEEHQMWQPYTLPLSSTSLKQRMLQTY